MAQNSLITTNKGFVKALVFNSETRETTIEYTDKIMFARRFSKSSANKTMAKHGIEGFLYKPNESITNPTNKNWEVIKQSDFSWNKEDTDVEIFIARKVSNGISDVRFILSGYTFGKQYYTEKEAKQLARKKNLEMLNKLQEKI